MYHYSALNANPNYCFSEIYPFGHMAYTFGQHVPCGARKLRFVHARMFRWWFHPYIATKAALRRIAIQTALHRQHLCRSQCVVRDAYRISHLHLIFNMMKCAMRYAETYVYPCQHVPLVTSPIHRNKDSLAAHHYADRIAQAKLAPLTICGALCSSQKPSSSNLQYDEMRHADRTSAPSAKAARRFKRGERPWHACIYQEYTSGFSTPMSGRLRYFSA